MKISWLIFSKATSSYLFLSVLLHARNASIKHPLKIRTIVLSVGKTSPRPTYKSPSHGMERVEYQPVRFSVKRDTQLMEIKRRYA